MMLINLMNIHFHWKWRFHKDYDIKFWRQNTIEWGDMNLVGIYFSLKTRLI